MGSDIVTKHKRPTAPKGLLPQGNNEREDEVGTNQLIRVSCSPLAKYRNKSKTNLTSYLLPMTKTVERFRYTRNRIQAQP